VCQHNRQQAQRQALGTPPCALHFFTLIFKSRKQLHPFLAHGPQYKDNEFMEFSLPRSDGGVYCDYFATITPTRSLFQQDTRRLFLQVMG